MTCSRVHLHIFPMGQRGGEASPKTEYQAECLDCGDKSQRCNGAGLCHQWFDIHRDQPKIGTSEPPVGVTN